MVSLLTFEEYSEFNILKKTIKIVNEEKMTFEELDTLFEEIHSAKMIKPPANPKKALATLGIGLFVGLVVLPSLMIGGGSILAYKLVKAKRKRNRIKYLIKSETDPAKKIKLKARLEQLDNDVVKLTAKMKQKIEVGKKKYKKMTPEQQKAWTEKSKKFQAALEKI